MYEVSENLIQIFWFFFQIFGKTFEVFTIFFEVSRIFNMSRKIVEFSGKFEIFFLQFSLNQFRLKITIQIELNFVTPENFYVPYHHPEEKLNSKKKEKLLKS